MGSERSADDARRRHEDRLLALTLLGSPGDIPHVLDFERAKELTYVLVNLANEEHRHRETRERAATAACRVIAKHQLTFVGPFDAEPTPVEKATW